MNPEYFSMRFRVLPVFAAFLAACCFSSCKAPQPKKADDPSRYYSLNWDPPAHRPKNPANVRVKVSTSRQRVYVMEGDRVLLATPCTVGAPRTPTPHGNFRVNVKTFKRRSYSYGRYPMPYWVEFKPAYGFHWGFIKPYPSTHGCIRLPKKAAPKFFALVNYGTPVNIAHSQPEDATVGAKLPHFDDGPMPNPPNSYLMTDAVFQDAVYKGRMFVD